jgi:hypothetical protein
MAGSPVSGIGPDPRPLVLLASRHGKERAMARPFRQGLGLELVVADQIDTDDFGTFTGERPRPADAATTCTEIQGCAQCDHRAEVPRRDGLLRADPQHCAHCNP